MKHKLIAIFLLLVPMAAGCSSDQDEEVELGELHFSAYPSTVDGHDGGPLPPIDVCYFAGPNHSVLIGRVDSYQIRGFDRCDNEPDPYTSGYSEMVLDPVASVAGSTVSGKTKYIVLHKWFHSSSPEPGDLVLVASRKSRGEWILGTRVLVTSNDVGQASDSQREVQLPDNLADLRSQAVQTRANYVQQCGEDRFTISDAEFERIVFEDEPRECPDVFGGIGD